MLKDATARWAAADSSELYNVAGWGEGFFSVHRRGNLLVHPSGEPARSLDLMEVVEQIRRQGIDPPVLIRFNDILQCRMRELHDAFSVAIETCRYRAGYTYVYPVKVNQQRQVIEQVMRAGRRFGIGLEVGSKPELLAALAVIEADTMVVGNGFKDGEYIRLVLLAQKLGLRVIPVIEKLPELSLTLHHARRIGVRPQLGMRVKLAAAGRGRWESSSGARSKFGLSCGEILEGLATLSSRGLSDCLQLLHFHIGSQVTDICHVRAALLEATRVYEALIKHGAGLRYLDVGGGLGVDYDGSQSSAESSTNYTLSDYAGAVVEQVASVCDRAGIDHPHLLSESGRAVAAYHSVLVFNAVTVMGAGDLPESTTTATSSEPLPIRNLKKTLERLSTACAWSDYHAAQQALEMALHWFAAGQLSLAERAQAEQIFAAICQRLRQSPGAGRSVPLELGLPDRFLAETYLCNFSLFQSIPDGWAIKQLFPVMPIHRLDEEPTRPAVLDDITCDSDGRIDRFVGSAVDQSTLRLHPINRSPYYLGAFLVGAYQEILGDLHNLFGNTHAVHVELGNNDEVVVESVVKGDTVTDVLKSVDFETDQLLRKMDGAVDVALAQQRLDPSEADEMMKVWKKSLVRYTYLKETGK